MNDLIPRACCHISDKVGRNEKPGAHELLVLSLSYEFTREIWSSSA
jgi:hypothetical protein